MAQLPRTRQQYADRLGVTFDALKWSLERGGLTFTGLVNAERQRRLKRLQGRNPRDFARELGFTNVSSFTAWHARVTGAQWRTDRQHYRRMGRPAGVRNA
jgi:hypothetical protein